jgi:DNA-binding XRE family transcriptional regulator
MNGTNFKDFKAELLEKPGVRRQYENLNPKYEIIQALISRRNELSLSQRKLAQLVGMHQPAICRLERGDNNVTVGTLFRVADVLGLDIEFRPRTLVKD